MSGRTDSTMKRADWVKAIAVYVVYIAVVLAPIWSGRLEPKWDGRNFNYPAFAYAADALADGRLPLWDPYTACGQPFFSDPAHLWYQPGAVVASFLRASHFDAYMLFWSATWAWAGFGALLLAAVLGAGPVGCVAAAISYSLSGFFVGHGQHLPYLVTAAWFPWVLAFAHRAVARVSWADTLLLGAALGLSALGGYAGLVIFEGIAVALWLGLAFFVPGSGPASEHPLPLRRRLAWSATVLATAAGLLAVVWSPSLWAFLVEAADFTDRTRPLSEEVVLRGSPFTLAASVTFLFPRISIDVCRANPAGCLGSDISFVNAYAGTLALPLAAIYLARDRGRAWWIGVFVAFWFCASLGADGGIRLVLHHLAPVTRYMRHNGMLRVLFLAPLTAAAGVGLTRAAAAERPLAARVLTAWVVVAALSAALATWAFEASGVAVLRWTLPALLVAAAAAVALWALPRSGTWVGAALVVLVGGDLAWHFQSNAFTIGDPSPQVTLRSVEALGMAKDPLAPRLTDPFFRDSKLNLVNRVPVVEGYVALVSHDFSPLLAMPFSEVLAGDRYWLSPAARPAPPRELGVAALARLGMGDPIPVFVDRANQTLPGAPVVPGTFGSLRAVSYEPERVELLADVPPGEDALLASTERFAPSWRVQIDGAERSVSVVNYFFKGVRLPAGAHRVVFEYRPRAFGLLFILSYAVLAAAIAGALIIERRARTLRARCPSESGKSVDPVD